MSSEELQLCRRYRIESRYFEEVEKTEVELVRESECLRESQRLLAL